MLTWPFCGKCVVTLIHVLHVIKIVIVQLDYKFSLLWVRVK